MLEKFRGIFSSEQGHRDKPNMGSVNHEITDEDLNLQKIVAEMSSIQTRLLNPNLTNGERQTLTEKLDNLEDQKRKDLGLSKAA